MITRLLTICVCFFHICPFAVSCSLDRSRCRSLFSMVFQCSAIFVSFSGCHRHFAADGHSGKTGAALRSPDKTPFLPFRYLRLSSCGWSPFWLSCWRKHRGAAIRTETDFFVRSPQSPVVLQCPRTAVCIGYGWYNFFRQSSTGLYHAAGSFCGNHLDWYFLSLHSNRFQQSNAHSSGTKKRAFFSALFLRCKRRPFDFSANRRFSGMFLCFAGGTCPSWLFCPAFQCFVFSACFSGIFTGVFWRSIGNDKGHPWGFPFS